MVNLDLCFYHPENEATRTCYFCKNLICEDDVNVIPDEELTIFSDNEKIICDYCLNNPPESEEDISSFEYCFDHSTVLASSKCVTCNRPICPECEYPFEKSIYRCVECNEANIIPPSVKKAFFKISPFDKQSNSLLISILVVVSYFLSFYPLVLILVGVDVIYTIIIYLNDPEHNQGFLFAVTSFNTVLFLLALWAMFG